MVTLEKDFNSNLFERRKVLRGPFQSLGLGNLDEVFG
jgi:hypothetical protein